MLDSISPSGPTVNVTVGTASASVAVPNQPDYVLLTNVGTQTAFVEVSSGVATATLAASFPLLPNATRVVATRSIANVAAIATAAGSVLYVTPCYNV